MREVSTATIPGGGFLFSTGSPERIFTPEDLTEEQRLVARTVSEFIEHEVLPQTAALEGKDWTLTRRLLRRLGDLGFLGAEIPEVYGGLGLDKVTALVITERLGPASSFAVSVGAHIGIGTLPIVFFGTDAQKRRYLPAMARGEKIGAYALTEPTAGSDAMGIRARAVRTSGGDAFLLSGTKQFISNAAFADIFITYARVDGEHHTAFIMERGTPGLTVGDEEYKLGITGSSTASLFLDQARVPVENVLGEIGQGHKIAFNILNVGRFKLAAGCLGAAKATFRDAVSYARDRRQFGRAIGEFGLIRQKIAAMAAALFAGESMVYRTGGLVAEGLSSEPETPAAVMAALEEYAIECSINKVFLSEVLNLVVDEAVQIYGGYGFIEEYPAARAYRDARINRLFEGTNEINRLLVAGMLLRRGQRGRLPLDPVAQAAQEPAPAPAASDGRREPRPAGSARHGGQDTLLSREVALVERAKRAALYVIGIAAQRHGSALEEEQEILGWLADIVAEIFAMDSAVLRAAKREEAAGGSAGSAAGGVRSVDGGATATLLAQVYIDDALPRLEDRARRMLAACASEDALRGALAGLRRLVDYTPGDTVALHRAIAGRMLEAGHYTLDVR